MILLNEVCLGVFIYCQEDTASELVMQTGNKQFSFSSSGLSEK